MDLKIVADSSADLFSLEDFPFALGHQVGTAIHDGGVLFGPNRGNYVGRVNAELKEGMCFTLEIGTRSERGIVGHEEIVRITKDGYELLSRRQNKIYLIG